MIKWLITRNTGLNKISPAKINSQRWWIVTPYKKCCFRENCCIGNKLQWSSIGICKKTGVRKKKCSLKFIILIVPLNFHYIYNTFHTLTDKEKKLRVYFLSFCHQVTCIFSVILSSTPYYVVIKTYNKNVTKLVPLNPSTSLVGYQYSGFIRRLIYKFSFLTIHYVNS